jgi:L-ectoine synthase
MIVRTEPVTSREWGHGRSDRYVVAGDGLGYGCNYTVVYAGTSSRLKYDNHIETVLCISGRGAVEERDNGIHHELKPGVCYILDMHDAHTLHAGLAEDLVVVCVFTPGLNGDEVHSLTDDGYSGF